MSRYLKEWGGSKGRISLSFFSFWVRKEGLINGRCAWWTQIKDRLGLDLLNTFQFLYLCSRKKPLILFSINPQSKYKTQHVLGQSLYAFWFGWGNKGAFIFAYLSLLKNTLLFCGCEVNYWSVLVLQGCTPRCEGNVVILIVYRK